MYTSNVYYVTNMLLHMLHKLVTILLWMLVIGHPSWHPPRLAAPGCRRARHQGGTRPAGRSAAAGDIDRCGGPLRSYCNRLVYITHRIHGAGIYANKNGVY